LLSFSSRSSASSQVCVCVMSCVGSFQLYRFDLPLTRRQPRPSHAMLNVDISPTDCVRARCRQLHVGKFLSPLREDTEARWKAARKSLPTRASGDRPRHRCAPNRWDELASSPLRNHVHHHGIRLPEGRNKSTDAYSTMLERGARPFGSPEWSFGLPTPCTSLRLLRIQHFQSIMGASAIN
jgi:hypothetical protein